MVTRERRNKLMAQHFDLCLVRNIPLEKEAGKKTLSYFAYMSPEEQLFRLLSDPEVFQQYLMSGQRNTLYDECGAWHGDFWQSAAYRKILEELKENPSLYPTILLGIYRLVKIQTKTYDLSFASTETKYIKLKTKPQNNIVIFGIFHKKLCYYFGFF